jgi:hypothetical protein
MITHDLTMKLEMKYLKNPPRSDAVKLRSEYDKKTQNLTQASLKRDRHCVVDLKSFGL